MISRRLLLGALLSGVTLRSLAWAEPPKTSLRPQLRGDRSADTAVPGSADRLVDAAKLGGVVSYMVVDRATGTVLEAREPQLRLPPASVAKSVTALYALDRLGPTFRYRTRVLATGPIVGGIVQGDLVLVGSGDPTLQTDQLGDLAASLAARGVKGITGHYLTWDAALPRIERIDPDQPVQVGYNPAVGGLNLNFNRVHFGWKKASGGGWGLAMDARGERFVPQVRMARVKVVERDLPVFTYAAQATEEDWTVASTALGKEGSRWLPVRLPGLYVAEVFQTLVKAQGIKLPPVQMVAVEPAGQELAALESEPLTEILRDMLKFSTNITAEAVGLRASGAGDLASSGAAMTQWVQTRFGVQSTFVDHSGLGSASRITAADMVKIFVQAKADGAGLQPLLRELGMRDDKGKAIKHHPVRVVAKSGTLNFVSGLVGHVLPPKGKDLVFAIFSADLARRDGLSTAQRESPPGGPEWTQRARRLQGQLINRWAAAYA